MDYLSTGLFAPGGIMRSSGKLNRFFLLASLSWIPQAHALPSPILFEENNPSDLDRFFNFFACFFPTSQKPVGGF
jgi:hypothetical protein